METKHFKLHRIVVELAKLKSIKVVIKVVEKCVMKRIQFLHVQKYKLLDLMTT